MNTLRERAERICILRWVEDSIFADHCMSIAGPTAGIKPLRVAVANLYNAHHRKGKASQYTWENVCIVPGGRAGLIRIAAVLNNSYLAFFNPDYSAYNEMLSLFKNVCPISISGYLNSRANKDIVCSDTRSSLRSRWLPHPP